MKKPIRIILQAKDIPIGCQVSKPTGATLFKIRKGVTLYTEDKQKVVLHPESIVLQGTDVWQCVHPTDELAVWVDSVREGYILFSELLEQEEASDGQ